MQDLRDINTDTYASGVPGLGNPQAVEILNRLSVAHWLEPMHAFLSETYAMLANVFMEEVETVFTQYRQTALYSALKAIILQYLDSIKADHYQQAIETYNIEYSKPFTIATTAFSKAQNEALQFLLHKRHALRIREYVKKMEELGQKCNPNNVTDTAIGPDRFLKEVEIGAVYLSLNFRHDLNNSANLELLGLKSIL